MPSTPILAEKSNRPETYRIRQCADVSDVDEGTALELVGASGATLGQAVDGLVPGLLKTPHGRAQWASKWSRAVARHGLRAAIAARAPARLVRVLLASCCRTALNWVRLDVADLMRGVAVRLEMAATAVVRAAKRVLQAISGDEPMPTPRPLGPPSVFRPARSHASFASGERDDDDVIPSPPPLDAAGIEALHDEVAKLPPVAADDKPRRDDGAVEHGLKGMLARFRARAAGASP